MTDIPTIAASLSEATHIEVDAGVRYWEDATVNGIQDTDGALIPRRDGDAWKVRIEIATGRIEGWPDWTTASIHYKVCDAGLYWLTDSTGERIAKWRGCYVPDDFLCHGDRGFGDYIIFKVGPDGMIENYVRPHVDPSDWILVRDYLEGKSSDTSAISGETGK